MPLFPRIPTPVSEGGDGAETKKGKGYEWIVNKFVEMADNIRHIKEQSAYDEDAGELAKSVTVLELEGSKLPQAKHDPVKPGVEHRIERVVIASAGQSTVSLYSDPNNTAQHLLGIVGSQFPGNEAGVGNNIGQLMPNIPLVIRPGEALSFAGNCAANGERITVIVWFRRISEAPQGLAVG